MLIRAFYSLLKLILKKVITAEIFKTKGQLHKGYRLIVTYQFQISSLYFNVIKRKID